MLILSDTRNVNHYGDMGVSRQSGRPTAWFVNPSGLHTIYIGSTVDFLISDNAHARIPEVYCLFV